jgi:hypothetical protein
MRASARRGKRAAVLPVAASAFAIPWVAAPTPAGAAMPWASSDPPKPDGLRAAVDPIVDRVFERARGLILLATGCAASLIVLHSLMRRWIARRDAAGR